MQKPQELPRGTRTEQGDSHCDLWSRTYTAREAKGNEKVITATRVWNAVVVLDGMSLRHLVKQHHARDACRRWLLKERKESEWTETILLSGETGVWLTAVKKKPWVRNLWVFFHMWSLMLTNKYQKRVSQGKGWFYLEPRGSQELRHHKEPSHSWICVRWKN